MKKAKMKTCASCGTEIAVTAKACPKCGAKNKKPIYQRLWFIALVVLVVLGAIGGMGGSDSEKKAPASGTTEEKQEIAYVAYSVDQLVKDLENNALKASNTYKEQNVEVTGELSVIDSDGAYISIKPEGELFSLYDVQCFLKDDDQRALAAELNIGDTVIVQGEITEVGEVMGYMLDIHNFVE